ncbi:glycoside hydrolase family 6 protein [Mycobacterium crocinum]|uniref:Glucanase n=1 Tax=Mycolicibacterium crocinum TaxID=388459 RepID=A0ABY3TTG7_9MYCO|nr:glycoside hydrolase family 6 protein [Mycolicibacterium crocinum]MCV7216567.1 glycoside hydrolase family 6 protein [Mycolicibacterium crocinum]ULN44654.1 glycoside hydrolase family 6 protein [Mycolicibacterium crocinum]
MSFAAGALARWIAPFLTLAVVAGLVFSTAPVHTGPIRLADDAAPAGGSPFYVDPNSAAMRASRANPDSPELAYIANTPQAYWIDNLVPAAAVSTYLNGAWAAGATPMLAMYSLPNRDCGSFASGGFGSAEAYRGWIDRTAAQIGGGPVTIILEPDALDMADCLSGSARQERFDLIRYGVDTLTRNPAAAVYVDAGHSRWLPADEIANRLNQVGIANARGFSLNVSNFLTTDEEIGYGEAISGMTGGKPYVIDTSRNGNGPAGGELYWCNPSGRALGVQPTTATGNGHIDAFLWVKRPGDSDGSCGRGNPGPGNFVNSFAIELARNAGH